MNQKNVQKLLEAFEARSDIMPVCEKSKCETILMAGAKAEAHCKGIDAIFSVSDKTKTSMMKIDGVFTVLDEAPGKLANAILLFTKGMYWFYSRTTDTRRLNKYLGLRYKGLVFCRNNC